MRKSAFWLVAILLIVPIVIGYWCEHLVALLGLWAGLGIDRKILNYHQIGTDVS